MAQTTKRALAASLKKLLSRKPLDRITVKDITDDCGVNRQTFYYHFADVYDLIDWIYLTEGFQVIGDTRTLETWQDGFLSLFDWILDNRAFVVNSYHSVSRENLENFLYSRCYDLLYGVVQEKSADYSVEESDCAFIANFFKYGFVGLVLEWIEDGMKTPPEQIISRLGILMKGDISAALERFSR